MIPLSVPEISGNEWAYVKDCLDTGWVSSVGSYVERFERDIAARVGSACAVAAVNGTAALHVALIVAGVRADDEVLVPALTFIAPANAVRYAGAWPVFVDVEAAHGQMDPGSVRRFLSERCRPEGQHVVNRGTGRRVRALLPVHLLGHPVDMDPLLETAKEFGLAVIEDATESLGARYKERAIGCLGDIACFSFNGNKIITTGGGGMIVTNNEAWAHQAKYLTTQAKDDPVEHRHGAVGYNYRLTNIQAAMGCAQLERLDEFIVAKRRIASAYAQGLAGVEGLSTATEAPWAFSTFWLYTVRVDPRRYPEDSRRLLRRLQAAGVQARPLWEPLHRSPAHRGAEAFGVRVADEIYEGALSLPSSVGLAREDQNRILELLRCPSGDVHRVTER